MFCKVTCVKAFLVLVCFFKIVSSTPVNFNFSPQVFRENYDRCEDLTKFRRMLYTLPADEAFKLISLPLRCADCPTEVQNIRLKLISLVRSGIINLNTVLMSLNKQHSRSRYDFLISVLMTMDEFLNLHWSIRQDIEDALLYMLRKRYLKVNRFESTKKKYCAYSNSASPYAGYNLPTMPFNPNSVGPLQTLPQTPSYNGYYKSPYLFNTPSNIQLHNYCKNKILELISKLLAIDNHRLYNCMSSKSCYAPDVRRPGINSGNPSITTRITTPKVPFTAIPTGLLSRPTINHYTPSTKPIITTPTFASTNRPQTIFPTTTTTQQPQIKPTPKVENLINVIPAPTYPLEKQMYDKFKVLLNSPVVQNVLNTIDFGKYHDKNEIMDIVIEKVLKTVKIEEVQQVFKFFLRYKEASKVHFNYGVLLDVLPQPQTLKEQKYYKIIQDLLTSQFIYDQSVSTASLTTTDLTQKLILLFKHLQQTRTVSTEVLEAINYYTAVLTGMQQHIDLPSLVTLLPVPSDDIETNKYNMLKAILQSNDIYVLMKNINLTNVSNNERLMLILRELITNTSYHHLSQVALYYRNVLIQEKYHFNYFDLLNLVTPTNVNSNDINVIRNYFYTGEFSSILSQLTFTGLSDFDKLLLILQSITSSSSNTRVVEAAGRLIYQLQQQSFYQFMDKLIPLIPAPQNDEEKVKHNIVTTFLKTEDAFNLLGHIDLTVFPDNEHLLEFVFKTIVESNVDANIKNTFEYYISLAEKLQHIEFVTRKEIKKNFKLTEIFTDTLDLKSLTLAQKAAFKKFFKYISEIKPDALSKFDSWDQAKTRGEFMKLLFKHLLDSEGTLPEIKESIRVLNSLVKMDGKGALPP